MNTFFSALKRNVRLILAFSLIHVPIVAFAGVGEVTSAILNSTETTVFVAAILAATIYFGHIRYSRFSLAHGPEILTTMGIMGCFFGIALALLDFDTNNVQKSVPLLLQGVKTAFWASLAGVAGALYLRFLHHVKKSPVTANLSQVKSASLDEVVATLLALKDGLVGSEQGTLLTQMRLMRQESSDKSDELIREFKGFAAHMVENNQKAIVEALRQVIADFNQKLTEQFGENFKQLNSAVEKLVLWQQQYKDELEQIKNAQQQTAKDLAFAADQLSQFVGKASQFSAIAESVQQQLDLMSKQKDLLFQQERALADVLSTMKDVTPTFAAKVDSMLKEVSTGVAKIEGELATVVRNLGAQVQSSNAELKTLLTDTMTKSQKEVNDGLKANAAVIKEGVLALDKALQTELNSALETLGRQLASLSNKFVEDYTPLTERLHAVVRMSKGV